MQLSDNSRKGRRFTLVELLVVIAILSILAGLLLPTLRAAIESAHQMECMNNFRQMHVAMTLYADGNRDYLPQVSTGYSLGGHWWTFADLLLPYIAPEAKLYGSYQGYIWQGSPFVCRSNLANYPTSTQYGIAFTCLATTGGWTEAYNHGGVTYSTNAKYYPKRLGAIRNASGTALATDSLPDSGGGSTGWRLATTASSEGGAYWYGNLISPCHKGGMNWLFADQHVTLRKYAPTNTTDGTAEFNQDWKLQK
jgi:prepilin-type N-terminal cleavage/methylation domain-containing protein/prepilin-type processing-associated H-X9-DG protein